MGWRPNEGGGEDMGGGGSLGGVSSGVRGSAR